FTEDNMSMADMISENFLNFPYRGTCLSLEEFDLQYGFRFEEQPKDFDEEYLVSFCEYIYNLIIYLNNGFHFMKFNISGYIAQIRKVIENIGYISAYDNGFTIFVPRDSAAISVAESELIPDDVSYKVIAYNHSSKKGDLEAKKVILIKLAELLEPKRKDLDNINKGFSSDLFMLINSCNIRHNNIDSALMGKYHKHIAEMSDEKLEHTYDEIYQMCLLAFMQLEHSERSEWVKDLKNKIVSVK
ncbi:MAG: hypothetical protein K2G88_04835, partial [Oscillospiraceae bacterium]|nr:hypothetical protein [Oscillospiraceae bacterium]